VSVAARSATTLTARKNATDKSAAINAICTTNLRRIDPVGLRKLIFE